MYSKWFHRVLNIVCLQHQQNRRVDLLIYTHCFKIARGKAFDQLQKCKHTHRICDINRRHKTALTFASLAGIKETESKVTPQSCPRVLYIFYSSNKHIIFLQTKMQILFCMCIYICIHALAILMYQIQLLQPLQMNWSIYKWITTSLLPIYHRIFSYRQKRV